MSGLDVFGIPVVESSFCERPATPGEEARRMVRHGMADVLEWLGESVGAAPGEPVRLLYVVNGQLLASAHSIAKLKARAALVAPSRVPGEET